MVNGERARRGGTNSRAAGEADRLIRRCLLLAALFAAAGVCCLLRLGQLQLWSAPANGLAAEAVRQRETSLVLDSGRGGIVDRAGRPIAGGQAYALAAFPVRRTPAQRAADARRLAETLGAAPADVAAWLGGLKAPALWPGPQPARGVRAFAPLNAAQSAAVTAQRIEGVYALPAARRYEPGAAGIHAVGYISQHPELLRRMYAAELAAGRMKPSDAVGGGGLESALDRLLRGTGKTRAMRYTDGKGLAMPGLDLRIAQPSNPYYPLTVVTTLDLPLQRELERYAGQTGLRAGAIVVLDARSADIAAMVSLPGFDPLEPGGEGGSLVNRALRAATPGSVFKLVTEAAALEAGAADEREQFRCTGHYGKYGLTCPLPEGHGTLTLREALAHSCNIVFATVAERLTPEQLALTADRLGLGRRIGQQASGPLGRGSEGGSTQRLLPEEEAGRVFLPAPLAEARGAGGLGGMLAQTGIGQRDAALSPLQAANLAVTLLHGGRVMAPRIVSEIRYADGKRMAALPPREAPSAYGRIRPATAHALLRGMEAVVADGTGRAARGGAWRLAGKSGTAETGGGTNHQWFVGYGPVEAPRYAVAVLAANRPPGTANRATQVFRGVMDILAARSRTAGSGG